MLAISDSDTNALQGTKEYGTIRARNTGSKTCTIDGYPGITLRLNDQAEPSTLSRAAGSKPRAVTLAPNAVASFGFSHSTGNAPGMCEYVDNFRVFDPDGSGYRTTKSYFRDCQRSEPLAIVVGPFEAGSNASIKP